MAAPRSHEPRQRALHAYLVPQASGSTKEAPHYTEEIAAGIQLYIEENPWLYCLLAGPYTTASNQIMGSVKEI